jgi:hypothetical protein
MGNSILSLNQVQAAQQKKVQADAPSRAAFSRRCQTCLCMLAGLLGVPQVYVDPSQVALCMTDVAAVSNGALECQALLQEWVS